MWSEDVQGDGGEVRHYLLTPFLKKIAHSSSVTLTPEGCHCSEYCSVLGQNTAIESGGLIRPGRHSDVDYTLTAYSEDDQQGKDPLYVIPVEAIRLKDVAQLSQYLVSISSWKYLQSTVVVLIDQECARLAFSVLGTAVPTAPKLPIQFHSLLSL